VTLASACFTAMLATILVVLAIARGVADWLEWPIWGGYLAVGIGLAVVGYVLFVAGRLQLAGVRAVAPETTATLKENFRWLTARSRSVNR